MATNIKFLSIFFLINVCISFKNSFRACTVLAAQPVNKPAWRYSNCYIHNHGVYMFTYIHEYKNTTIYVTYIYIRMKVFNKQKCRLSYIQLKMLLFTYCATSLIFCACAAAMLLQDYFHHHAKTWRIRIMDHEQNGCFGGMTRSVPRWPWPKLEPTNFLV